MRPGGFGVLGLSRGAGMALLAGVRDERIERIAAFSGPTDLFDPWVAGHRPGGGDGFAPPSGWNRLSARRLHSAMGGRGNCRFRYSPRTGSPLRRPVRGRSARRTASSRGRGHGCSREAGRVARPGHGGPGGASRRTSRSFSTRAADTTSDLSRAPSRGRPPFWELWREVKSS